MHFFSSIGKVRGASLSEALFQGFAPDGGLYLPSALPHFSLKTQEEFLGLSFPEVSFEVAKRLFHEDLDEKIISSIVEEAFNFPIPVIPFQDDTYALELHHGPTLSFKDFGARFLAQLIKHLWKKKETLKVLVATTGDTGSAVGSAFLTIPHTHVYILFPKGRVTPSQEKQLTTIGNNVTALEIDGTFDDCQALLKRAILDPEIRKQHSVTTGNSINIGRILPQILYFFYAYGQIETKNIPMVVSVPCGNFGHLVSAIFSKKMGLPIDRFVAATNINDEVPLYLKSGIFKPHPSWQTIAVSMDVGNPSNFSRFVALFHGSLSEMRKDIVGISFTDEQIREALIKVDKEKGYILDPHGAISYLALHEYRAIEGKKHPGLFLATAHPSKFIETVQPLVKEKIFIPERLEQIFLRKKEAVSLSNRYEDFKNYLFSS